MVVSLFLLIHFCGPSVNCYIQNHAIMNMCKCAFVQVCIFLSGQSLLYISGNIRPWKHWTLRYPNCAQGRIWLDFMNVKFDLSLLWVHMSKGAFSHRLQLFFRHDITKTNLFKYTENLPPKMIIFRYKNSDIFHISAQNIDCGYSLEPPGRGGSNEYPQSMIYVLLYQSRV